MGAVSEFGNYITRIASTDLERGRVVRSAATAGQVTYCTATDDEILGVTEIAVSSGEPVTIKTYTPGFEYTVTASAAVSFSTASDNGRGTSLELTTTGRVVTGTNQRFAAQEAGDSGGLIRVLAVANKYGDF